MVRRKLHEQKLIQIAEAVARKYHLRELREFQIKKRHRIFESKQRERRHRDQEMNNFTLDAIEIIKAEAYYLANCKMEVESNSDQCSKLMEKVENIKYVTNLMNQLRNSIKANVINKIIQFKKRLAKNEAKYEKIAIKKLRRLLTDRHIQALQQDARCKELRKFIGFVLLEALESRIRNKIECQFCGRIFICDQLLMKHTKFVHFQRFIEKVLKMFKFPM